VTPSSVLVWLRKLFPEHQHSYSKHELVNMASVRLFKSPLHLTPDARASSFELSCAVALSSLIGRMPGEWLTSPKRRYQSFTNPCGKVAADEEALARRHRWYNSQAAEPERCHNRFRICVIDKNLKSSK
jgi:hypothetical protein